MQIVIAWAEKTKMVPTGGHTRRDMNLFPEFRFEWEGKAAMWVRSGCETDIARAKAFAEKEGHSVFTFDAAERDPLAKARQKAADNARNAE